jgi:hypothetical protein
LEQFKLLFLRGMPLEVNYQLPVKQDRIVGELASSLKEVTSNQDLNESSGRTFAIPEISEEQLKGIDLLDEKTIEDYLKFGAVWCAF